MSPYDVNYVNYIGTIPCFCRAQQQKCNYSHLTMAMLKVKQSPASGTYNLTLTSFTLAQSQWKHRGTSWQLTHREPCVTKQLHSTQWVSMTTKKLLGKLTKWTAIVPMLFPLAARHLITSTSSHRTSNQSGGRPSLYIYLGNMLGAF